MSDLTAADAWRMVRDCQMIAKGRARADMRDSIRVLAAMVGMLAKAEAQRLGQQQLQPPATGDFFYTAQPVGFQDGYREGAPDPLAWIKEEKQ